MTRLPADAFLIEPLRGEEYPPYRVPSMCALQGCSSINVDPHHIVRRSWTIGPYDWVSIGGVAVGNLMPLCWRHHREVTDNRSRIVWDERYEEFFWETPGRDRDLRLRQPPKLKGHVVTHDVPTQESHVGNGHCPTCHRRLSPAKIEGVREEKRPRKTWSITVPNDTREIGANVLDNLLESARLILDDHGMQYGQERGIKYFILSTSLGLFVAHADEILDDGGPRPAGGEREAQEIEDGGVLHPS